MDTLRTTIIARAESLGLSAYAIAQQAEMDPQTVKRYLSERCSLNSRYVSQICSVLGLELKPSKRVRKVASNADDEAAKE